MIIDFCLIFLDAYLIIAAVLSYSCCRFNLENRCIITKILPFRSATAHRFAELQYYGCGK